MTSSPRNRSGPKAVLICGPTASGKSSLAIEIAERNDGVVINADAMQVYSCWKILTARPTRQDEARVPHLLFGHVDKTTRYSVGSWLQDIRRVLESNKGGTPVIVGGTGLYFAALTTGLAPVPEIPEEVRSESTRIQSAGTLDGMIDELRSHDPDAVRNLDLNNAARIVRAWEVLRASGRSLSYWQALSTRPLLPLEDVEPILLWPDTGQTAVRIERRLHGMIADGVVEECRKLLEDWDPTLPYSKALGAREFRAHLEDGVNLKDTIARVSTVTRQFAKRQRTWFRSRMSEWRRMTA